MYFHNTFSITLYKSRFIRLVVVRHVASLRDCVLEISTRGDESGVDQFSCLSCDFVSSLSSVLTSL